MPELSRHIPAEGAFNIRDLGGYPTRSGQTIPWRRFLRADSLHRLAPTEPARLFDTGLRKVIDLRTPKEMQDARNPFESYEGVDFVNLPLFDDLSPEALSRTRRPGDDPLLAFYMAALETRGEAIRKVMQEMAAQDDGAVLFNCTAGKDRTGIVAALLLGHAGVPNEKIVEDYTLTSAFISDLVKEFLQLSRERGGDTESYAKLLKSPATTMLDTLARIEADYGSIPGYLQSVGLAKADATRLRERLLQPQELAP